MRQTYCCRGTFKETLIFVCVCRSRYNGGVRTSPQLPPVVSRLPARHHPHHALQQELQRDGPPHGLHVEHSKGGGGEEGKGA